ncbi:hypothetical protein D9613_008088 [Agrocybe pediades]|uniref:Uncharacterized protein n=1 Tax=Agrocybe pediades TaxID=84607 RepID=A0A8H4QNY2_9AGAR|nr:hypothetical protein D9613_008088 [Agrocybe pediades]
MVLGLLERFWGLIMTYLRGNLTADNSASSLLSESPSTRQLGLAELAIGRGGNEVDNDESLSVWQQRKEQFLRHPSLRSANQSGEQARSVRGKNKLSNAKNDDQTTRDNAIPSKGRSRKNSNSAPATTIPWTKYVPPPPIVTIEDWSSLPPGIENMPTPPRPPRPPSVFLPALVVTPASSPSTTGNASIPTPSGLDPASGLTNASWSSFGEAEGGTSDGGSFSRFDQTSPLDRITASANAAVLDTYSCTTGFETDEKTSTHLSPDSAAMYYPSFRTSKSDKPSDNNLSDIGHEEQQKYPSSSVSVDENKGKEDRNNPFFRTGSYSRRHSKDQKPSKPLPIPPGGKQPRRMSFILPETYNGVRLDSIGYSGTPLGLNIVNSTAEASSPYNLASNLDAPSWTDTSVPPTLRGDPNFSIAQEFELTMNRLSDDLAMPYTTSTPAKSRNVDHGPDIQQSREGGVEGDSDIKITIAQTDTSRNSGSHDGLSTIQEEGESMIDNEVVLPISMHQQSHPAKPLGRQRKRTLDLPQDHLDLLPYPDVFDLDFYLYDSDEGYDGGGKGERIADDEKYGKDKALHSSVWPNQDEVKPSGLDLGVGQVLIFKTFDYDVLFSAETPVSAKRFGFISVPPPSRNPAFITFPPAQEPDTPSPDLNTFPMSFVLDTPSPLPSPSFPVDMISSATGSQVSSDKDKTQRYRDHYRHHAYSCAPHLSSSSSEKDSSSSSTQFQATSTSSDSGTSSSFSAQVNQAASSSGAVPRVTVTTSSLPPGLNHYGVLKSKSNAKGKAPTLPVTARIHRSKSDPKKIVLRKIQEPKAGASTASAPLRKRSASTDITARKAELKDKENTRPPKANPHITPSNTDRTTPRPLPPPIVIVSHHRFNSLPTNGPNIQSQYQTRVQAVGPSSTKASEVGSRSQEVLKARLKEACDNFSKSVWTDESYTIEAISITQD